MSTLKRVVFPPKLCQKDCMEPFIEDVVLIRLQNML